MITLSSPVSSFKRRAWVVSKLTVLIALSAASIGFSSAALAVSPINAKAEVSVQAGTPVTIKNVLEGYAQLVYAGYQDAEAEALKLQAAVEALLAKPSQQTLDAARQAWLEARTVYGQTEVFRFYGGPIDDENGPEGQINAWPMDESYVDYVVGAPQAGLVNDPSFAITKDNLIKFNERGGEENIATGWHAIEFLLWGQDLSETGPGNRPWTDYSLKDGDQIAVQRRRQYLELTVSLLVDNLGTVKSAWVPGSKVNYRGRFVQGGTESLRSILIGMGSLSRGELAGERMEVALFSMDQEDEHSCFSDNTHNDVRANSQGILNVWQGRYARPDGQVLKVDSLAQLVAQQNAEVSKKTGQAIAETVRLAQQIQAPFDREISGGADGKGRDRIEATVASLIHQSEEIVAAASAIGLSKLTLVHP